ncbi:MAG: SCO2322 family protein [Actinobacteria bacterium]|nr:SCO2322 family protein [Actinomycetota bacterium]
MTQYRRIILIPLLVLATMLGGALLAAPAQADTYYRYWTYWSGSSSTWTFAATSPDTYVPADGAVDGWRFDVAPESGNARAPRIGPDFTTICGSTAAVAGSKRVAVVIDDGAAEDAPEGSTPSAPTVACAVVPTSANSLQTLAAVATERLDKTLLCAIDGYPATGCGDQISLTSPPPTAEATFPVPVPSSLAAVAPASTQTASSTPWGTIIGGLAIIVLIVIAVVLSRRRRA